MPDLPGVYRYYDKEGTIIYVGKAKNLRRRVNSYFTKEHESPRTARLVRQIWDLKYVVVNTETDALNLENRMIKEHQPKYNVLLKDGKTYPWICVRNEDFPRVFLTRNLVRDGSQYFGPYTNVGVGKVLIEFFERTFRLRTCSLNLKPQLVATKGYKTCLKYHLGKCDAPCISKVSRETYNVYVEQIKQILRGHTQELLSMLREEMMEKAADMKFEEAADIKRRIELIEGYRAKSNIVPSSIHNVDVFAYEEADQTAYITFFHLVHGAVVSSYTIEYKKQIDEEKADVLATGIAEMRERFESTAVEILVPFAPSMVPEGVVVTVPQRGDKRRLLEFAEKNLRQYRIDQIKQADKLNPEQRTTRLLSEIQQQLGLPRLPRRIESFDNSNISGSDAVAACVVFTNGKPDKSQYRKFNIQTVVGADDYASMREVVMRRYKRMIEEDSTPPDLILADGGVGQMHVIEEGLAELTHQYFKQQLQGELSEERFAVIREKLAIPVGGLVKNEHHRTRQMLFGDPPQAVDVKQGSTLFHLLERIQEEVHRFAISFHRQKRAKSQLRSEFEAIPGIGPKTQQALLREFHSLKRVKEAPLAALSAVVGPAKAKALRDWFDNVPRETWNLESGT